MTSESSTFTKYWLFFFTLALLAFAIWVFYLNFHVSRRNLTFAMLNIGQGDALFIESPTGTQLLFDAGPPRKILSELTKVMPSYDKTIDAIVITNPDQDHIGGFQDVLKTYKVSQVFEPGTFNESRTYQNLETEIKNKNITKILAKQGMRLDIGGGAYVDVLFPDRDVSEWTSNDGSIIARLVYGETSVMLTGDATFETERIVDSEYAPQDLQSDVLKVGHHGSRTSTSDEFVKEVHPKHAVISDGKDNKYGHPHQEVLDLLTQYGVEVFRTDLLGTIIMKSDGIKEIFSFRK